MSNNIVHGYGVCYFIILCNSNEIHVLYLEGVTFEKDFHPL